MMRISVILFVLQAFEQVRSSMVEHNEHTSIGIITSIGHRRGRLAHYLNEYQWSLLTKECYALNFPRIKYILVTNFSGFYGEDFRESKPYVLKHYLQYFTWVMWADVDAYFQDFSISVSTFLDNAKHIVVQDFEDEVSFNNGVFFIRNSQYGYRFLDIWIDMLENHCKGGWAYGDQNAFLETTLIVLNETRVSGAPAYNGECRVVPKCTYNANCYKGWWDRLGFKYQNRNIRENTVITFWHHNLNDTVPERAFGFFGEWGIYPENVCKSTDIICHSHYDQKHYKEMSNRIPLNSTCETSRALYLEGKSKRAKLQHGIELR